MIAGYIDAENINKNDIEKIKKIMNKHGDRNQLKAFGTLRNSAVLAWEKTGMEHGIQFINCSQTSNSKNTTDLTMAINIIQDINDNSNISKVLICSSDADYTPVIHKLKSNGLVVLGFGSNSSNKGYTACFDNFYVSESMNLANTSLLEDTSEQSQANIIEKDNNLLLSCMKIMKKDQWVTCSELASFLIKDGALKPKEKAIKKLISTNQFEIVELNGGPHKLKMKDSAFDEIAATKETKHHFSLQDKMRQKYDKLITEPFIIKFFSTLKKIKLYDLPTKFQTIIEKIEKREHIWPPRV